MGDFTTSLSISSSGMQAQSARLRLTSENIANADTPGFRRKTVSFQQVADRQGGVNLVSPGAVRLDRSDLTRVFAPGHPLAGEDGYYAGSNVDLVLEIADAREAQRSYEANLRMFDQTRQMALTALDLLKR